MLTPLIYLLGLAIQTWYAFSYQDDLKFTLPFMVCYAVMAYYFEIATMELSVGAIRYLRPTWDKEEPGEYLWPAILYWFGIKEHTGGQQSANKEGISESA